METTVVPGKTYIGNEHAEFWIENSFCRLEVERVEDTEIRIGIMLPGDEVEAAGIYLTDAEALTLMAAIAGAVKIT